MGHPAKSLLGLLRDAVAPPAHSTEEIPYVRTPEAVVEAMLAIGEVTGRDTLVDLGSGNGRIVIAAAREFGARGVGIEWNPALVAQSRRSAIRQGVAERVTFLQQDLFTADIRNATVVTMYLLPEMIRRLRPRLLSELRPGTRIVSHDFDMGDWKPDGRCRVEAPGKSIGWSRDSKVYLWIVPAKAAGRWSGTLEGPGGMEPLEIDIAQACQEIAVSGSLSGGSVKGAGRIRGDAAALLLDRASEPGRATLWFDLEVKEDFLEGEGHDGEGRYGLRAARPAGTGSRSLWNASGVPEPEIPHAVPVP